MSTMATSTSDTTSPNRSLNQPMDDEASGSTRPKKKSRSLVWNDFEKTKNEQGNDIAICNHCKEKFTAASGTSNLKNHINRCKARKVGLSQQGATTKKDEGTPSSRTFKFNQERSRRDVAKMIVKHEYPFIMVDHEYFREFVHNLQPSFDLKHQNTVSSDIMQLYKEEKQELYKVLTRLSSRISLTTDLWTAQNTRDSYLCLTCHFIDDEWVLRKKILNFRLMECGHTGEEIGKVVLKCLYHWNIDKKLLSITLDNASANDSMIAKLKGILSPDLIDVEMFHIRCATHILNLIVKDGLATLGSAFVKIRESCKYVRSTPQRKSKWNVAVDQVRGQVSTNREICLDCPTRWNSSYEMLTVALEYQEAFIRLAQIDDDFKTNPLKEEWEFASTICDCLKVFYDSTKTLSGALYPTADIYFSEVCEINICLTKWLGSENVLVQDMAKRMMVKFKKYWTRCNLTLAIAYVLNPGYKLIFVRNYYHEIYGELVGESYARMVTNALVSLYNRYAPQKTSGVLTTQTSSATFVGDRVSSSIDITSSKSKRMEIWYQREGISSTDSKSELDNYLEEPLFRVEGLNVLDWWKLNSPKYPTLSRIARDILAIPVSSVPSESAFSTGGRVLNDHRSSLSPKKVEALICTQSWLPPLSDSFTSWSTNEPTEANSDENDDQGDYNNTSLIENLE